MAESVEEFLKRGGQITALKEDEKAFVNEDAHKRYRKKKELQESYDRHYGREKK